MVPTAEIGEFPDFTPRGLDTSYFTAFAARRGIRAGIWAALWEVGVARTARGDDLLARLAAGHREQGDVIRLGRSEPVCLADPAAAKAVLGNADGRFREHSDFFHLRRGTFGPREAQLAVAREGRIFLRGRMAGLLAAIPEAVEHTMLAAGPAPTTTSWPDTGNRLLHRLTATTILGPHRGPAPRALLDEIIERGVLAGAGARHPRRDRARFRRRAFAGLAESVRGSRRAVAAGAADRDLVDVIARAAGPAPDGEVAEVVLSHVFALTGSIGFTLGWCLLLTEGVRPAGVPTGWIVREALRLWPVAWLFGRTVAEEHEVGGVRLREFDDVMVCSYLVHRHPRHWPAPDEFRPERWAEAHGAPAYVPFGWGAHSCTGAAIALELVERLLDEILSHDPVVLPSGGPAGLGPALAPPPFHVRAAARTSAEHRKPERR